MKTAVNDSDSPASISQELSPGTSTLKSFPSTLQSTSICSLTKPVFVTVHDTETGWFCSGCTLMSIVESSHSISTPIGVACA